MTTSQLSSRFCRSMLECVEILSVAAQKGIHVYAVKGNWRLDNSIQSKIIAMAFSMAAEIERDLISQRTIVKVSITQTNRIVIRSFAIFSKIGLKRRLGIGCVVDLGTMCISSYLLNVILGLLIVMTEAKLLTLTY